MTKNELQGEYNKRGYSLSLRGNVWYITKQGQTCATSLAYPGTAMTLIYKKYSREAVNDIDSVIQELDQHIVDAIRKDKELSIEE